MVALAVIFMSVGLRVHRHAMGAAGPVLLLSYELL
jgi:hypothetical protein